MIKERENCFQDESMSPHPPLCCVKTGCLKGKENLCHPSYFERRTFIPLYRSPLAPMMQNKLLNLRLTMSKFQFRSAVEIKVNNILFVSKISRSTSSSG